MGEWKNGRTKEWKSGRLEEWSGVNWTEVEWSSFNYLVIINCIIFLKLYLFGFLDLTFINFIDNLENNLNVNL